MYHKKPSYSPSLHHKDPLNFLGIYSPLYTKDEKRKVSDRSLNASVLFKDEEDAVKKAETDRHLDVSIELD